ncbi:MAG: type II toxin-antitoxin system VapC family toxin [Candidatus Scalinduaceae bacterium]
MKPIVIDTPVWVDWARGKNEESLKLIHGRMVYMPSVVIMELLAGARDKYSKKTIKSTIDPFIKHNRIVNPGLKDFVKAGDVLSQLEWPASKRSNDVLITVLTGKIGAQIITSNPKDFEPICRLLNINILNTS